MAKLETALAAPRAELAKVTLDDKYTLEHGHAFMTGIQALVRLPMLQRARDRAAGLNTAGFVTGYRGSPLAGLDQAFLAGRRHVAKHDILVHPGVNEDLAATSVWGTQQVGLAGDAKVDGVFALWYAKGPGVDRTGDVFRHANLAGTARHGGVLVIAGDDHTCKSSTTAHQTEYAFMDAMIPVLAPAGVQEFLDYGLYGWALSRYSGCWIAFKAVAETVETSARVIIDPDRVRPVLPTDFELPADGVSIRWPDTPLAQEYRLHRYKSYAALAFARANNFNRQVFGPTRADRRRYGVVTTGKSYLDLRQAFDDLGIDAALADEIGLAVYKVGMVWPLEREGVRAFAEGLEEIIVVEEKRAVIENQLKEQLYNWRADVRPRVVGKFDEKREWIFPSAGELTPAMIARVLFARIPALREIQHVRDRIAVIEEKDAEIRALTVDLKRTPYFCSGCPHNTSTNVPEGSRALAGIGCHYMTVWMPDRRTSTFTQMGGEGASWIGQAPFVTTEHVFANLGDGTYFHSGSLAVRAAIAAKVNITYKILYNDAVAMTGGQRVDGQLSPDRIARQMRAEGVERIAVVSDEPSKYPVGVEFPAGTSFHHRDEFDSVQKSLREWPGVSVLIYDQTCAAEKRRRRKRGSFPDPAERVFINQAVCEGCGDCSRVSNCLSVTPVETEFGRKRAIDQSSCNKDYSCVNGFCPSFVSVKGGSLRQRKLPGAATGEDPAGSWPPLPEPTLPALDTPFGIVVTGIGGTGVVTIGALIGMAAHLEGRGVSVLDMTGLAQKGGEVVSHVRIARSQDEIHSVRIATGEANTVIGCDIVTTAAPDTLARMRKGLTRAVVNDHETMTGAFTQNPDFSLPTRRLKSRLEADMGSEAVHFLPATELASGLLGDAIATNAFMLGYAWQEGLVPLSQAAILKAIELNGAAVRLNTAAFQWGRRAAVDPEAVALAARPETSAIDVPLGFAGGPDSHGDLDRIIALRKVDLTAYQDEALASRYGALVRQVAAVEADRVPGRAGPLAEAVALAYHKLLAVKDEYEVARLYSDGRFRHQLASSFEGDYRLELHLAPPLLARRDPATGLPVKRRFGPWVFSVLGLIAGLKRHRGRFYDPFGWTAERRMERRLVQGYEALLVELMQRLSPANHDACVRLARLPLEIRGFGHVKMAAAARVKAEEQRQLEALRSLRATREATPEAAE